MANAQPTPRPFLKWVGGKRQLLPRILEEMPSRFADYHEPFLGGGALFFELSRRGELYGRRIYLGDSNTELIQTYRAVRDDVEGVIAALRSISHSETTYYKIRLLNWMKLLPASLAARMIYLNRTCFNGLYRVNKKGGFNVPMGDYANPVICDDVNLREASSALGGVHIQESRFETSFDGLGHGVGNRAFLYLDPPYIPVSATANFTSFTPEGFDLKMNEELHRMFNACAQSGGLVLLSNADTDWARDHYRNCKIVEVKARRNVNSDAGKRGPVPELLIASYTGERLGIKS